MKQRAILYTRVSTDEQNNGYSPADQKERLYKYADQNNIEVVAFYHDDESGKTFNRPQWINIMNYLKKHSSSVDLIIFIKWDRFSRNVSEAYITINALQKYGVEPQAIEQPLDFEIPEQKIMLAIYLAAPEVDNDRRALNVFHGMRRAKKEGRWIGVCPKGYRNTRDACNKPIIVPEAGKDEALIKKAYEEFSTGLFHPEELRKHLKKDGMKLSKNAFVSMLKNKAYIGKIFLPAYKDESAQWVDGIHESLISDELFYEVQDVFLGRSKKNFPNKIKTVRDELPLRGYLECPRCAKPLTGSASTGRSGVKFYYYHCSKGCKERIKALDTNDVFAKKLRVLRLNSVGVDLIMKSLKTRLKSTAGYNKSELEGIVKAIEKNKQRLKNAQVLMLDGELNPTEYKELKLKLEEDLLRLSIEENKLRSNTTSYDKIIDTCRKVMLNLDIAYDKAESTIKQRIVGSIFPEKFIFENNEVRTAKVNEMIDRVCSKINTSKGNKKGQQSFYELLPCRVEETMPESNEIIKDLAKIQHVKFL